MKKPKTDPSEIRITHKDFLLVATPNDSLENIKSKFPHIHFSHHMSSNYIYIVDEKEKLIGVVSIGEVLFSEKNQKISDIMHTKLITAKQDINKYRITHLALRHNLKAIPIVDHHGKLVGAVNSDQMLHYLRDIYHSKILKLAGIKPHDNSSHTSDEIPILNAYQHRVGWVVLGLIGGIFGAKLIDAFELVLERNLILASFIPLVVYVSAAVGNQTQTFYIRDIALNPKIKVVTYFMRQLLISILIALTCGVAIWVMVALFWQDSYTGFMIGVASAISIVISTFIAVIIPYVLDLIGQDPADGGGPFATIMQDLTSILVYFVVATALL